MEKKGEMFMSAFMSKDFLLTTSVAKELYHSYASDMPIIDYHCHVSPKEIYEDKHFENITQVWLGGDHYKWRLMRSNGVDEHYITGNASDREKFQKFAEMMPKAIGNPMYHWCHLELKNYFGYEGVLNGETAQEVWELACEKLAHDDMGVRGLIAKSNVAFIGTTDDPIDSLEYHSLIAKDDTMKTVVAPSFRPDKALNIEKDGWREYITALSDVCGIKVDGFDTLKAALADRIEFFEKHGCRSSDHGLDYMVFTLADDEQLDEIVKRGLKGEKVDTCDAEKLKTALLVFCAKQYEKRGWVMQLHYNCFRNNNSLMFKKIGADTGFDCIGPHNGSLALSRLLDALNTQNALPRTVIYSLDPTDNAFIGSLIGCFQGGGVAGKIQHGSAWWFNDNKQGMRDQMISLANLGLLGNFIGMLTDSRSFLSYTRHEYFRRILCALIGEWVEGGEYPDDIDTLGTLIKDICYNNALKYFGLEEKLG